MKKIIKYFFLSVLIIFILIQFIPRPEKNISAVQSPNVITASHKTPADIQQILESSCYDCHSNNTKYPWYSDIQPFAWWLGDHVKDGKKHLNFSEFGTYDSDKQAKKFEEIAEEVEEGEMPLRSYTFGHPEAKLSKEEKTALISWAMSLSSRYPDIKRKGKNRH